MPDSDVTWIYEKHGTDPNTTLHEWIMNCPRMDWAAIVIAPDMSFRYISDSLTFRGRLTTPYALQGIHVRDLLVVVDLDDPPEDWLPTLVASLTTGANHQVIRFTKPKQTETTG
jgi:hypothetical protein